MALYQRNWDCAVCGQSVTYDSETDTIRCDCGEVKNVIRDGIMKIDDLNNYNWRLIQ